MDNAVRHVAAEVKLDLEAAKAEVRAMTVLVLILRTETVKPLSAVCVAFSIIKLHHIFSVLVRMGWLAAMFKVMWQWNTVERAFMQW